MAGEIRRSLRNQITSSGSPDRLRDMFTHIFTFFEDHPSFTRIASYYGENGTGFGFSNASDESGENAWVIWRNTGGAQPYDMAWRWSFNSFSTSGVSGSWSVGSSNWGVAVAVAFHSSSASFAGTTNNNGQDSFNNSNPWKSGSLVFPTQNMAGGSEQTEQRYAALVDNSPGSGTGEISIVGDDDGWVIVWDQESDNDIDSHAVFERYVPFVSGTSHPYFMSCDDASDAMLQNTAIGSYSDTNGPNGGVSVGLENTNEDHTKNGGVFIGVSSYANMYKPPIPLSNSIGEIYEWPYIIGVIDNKFGDRAPVGYLNLVRTTYPVLTSSDLINSGAEDLRIVQRTASTGHPSMTIPWTGSVEPPAGTFYPGTAVFMTGAFGFTNVSASLKTEFGIQAEGTGGGGTELVPIYRGENPPGTFVYSEGSPPVGAVNVILVGFR